MKKLTSKGKPFLKRKTAPSKSRPKAKPKTKPSHEPDGLEEPEQPLFFYGPPPSIKTLYTKNEFDRKFHPQDLLKHMQEGSTKSEICAAWGVTYSKFNEWLDAHPEFASAYAAGKPAYDAFYKRALRLAAFGQLKTVKENSLFFMLKNVAGFTEDGGHEFSDGNEADVEFVDDDDDL
jgi:hypothetical protein